MGFVLVELHMTSKLEGLTRKERTSVLVQMDGPNMQFYTVLFLASLIFFTSGGQGGGGRGELNLGKIAT